MKHLREYLLIVAYIILIAIVAFETFWIDKQFDDSHRDQCIIAEVQANLAVANLASVVESGDRAKLTPIINKTIRALNDTCDRDIKEIQ